VDRLGDTSVGRRFGEGWQDEQLVEAGLSGFSTQRSPEARTGALGITHCSPAGKLFPSGSMRLASVRESIRWTSGARFNEQSGIDKTCNRFSQDQCNDRIESFSTEADCGNADEHQQNQKQCCLTQYSIFLKKQSFPEPTIPTYGAKH